MASIDAKTVERLTAPISPEAPSGPSFEYDPAYLEMDQASQGTPEQVSGKETISAIPPNWKEVRAKTLELGVKTHDLRVLVLLSETLLAQEGFIGFRDGLKVLQINLEKYWDTLHPVLDASDNNDPTERMNILRVFASRSPGQPESVILKMIREAPLVNSRQVGRFGLKEISRTPGEGATKDTKVVEWSLIEGAAKDTEPEFLKLAFEGAKESAVAIRTIEKFIDGKVAKGQGIDFKDAAKMLDEATSHLQNFLALHGLGGPPAPAEAAAAGATGAKPAGAPTAAAPAPAAPGEIRSVDDVVKTIDRIVQFYAKTEPSSPVPLILKRAQRLVGKDFWQILKDLSPKAIDEVKVVAGEGPEGKPPEKPAK